MRPGLIAGLAVAGMVAVTTVQVMASQGSDTVQTVPVPVPAVAPASGPQPAASSGTAKAGVHAHIPHPYLLHRPYVLRRWGGGWTRNRNGGQ